MTQRRPNSHCPHSWQNVERESRAVSSTSGLSRIAPVKSIPNASRIPLTSDMQRRAPLRRRKDEMKANARMVPVSVLCAFIIPPAVARSLRNICTLDYKTTIKTGVLVNQRFHRSIELRAC